jgi:DnaJ-class molecular chaperone
MNIDDSYRELGLAPGSSDAEVKEAWRRLAARWHPDRNASPHALRKIQRINRAVDEIRRWKAGGVPTPEAPAPAAPPEAPPPAEAPEAPASEVIEHLFAISIEEACTGCSRELHGDLVEDCADCAGTGSLRHAMTCTHCAGSGRTRQNLWFAWLSGHADCSACDGTGTVRKRCTACHGSGKSHARKYRCRVEVPAGTRAGEVLDVSARVQGRQKRHTLALRVRIELQPHPFFRLDADGTVQCELPVDGFAWMAQRWIEVPTPRGAQQMRLKRGFLTYRIKGHGLPGEAGDADCMITVVPLFPEELGPEQQLLVDRLVAGNTGARGTTVGERMAAWQAQLTGWKAR